MRGTLPRLTAGLTLLARRKEAETYLQEILALCSFGLEISVVQPIAEPQQQVAPAALQQALAFLFREDEAADAKRVANVNGGCAGSILRVANKARHDQHAAESNMSRMTNTISCTSRVSL